MTLNRTILLAAAALLLVASLPATAQEGNAWTEPEMMTFGEALYYPTFEYPGMVHTYMVGCSAGPGIKVSIQDCCMEGDNWEAHGVIADGKPVVGAATGTGALTNWRSFLINGTEPIRAKVQVRYCHGVNVFPASAVLKIACVGPDAELSIFDLGQLPDLQR